VAVEAYTKYNNLSQISGEYLANKMQNREFDLQVNRKAYMTSFAHAAYHSKAGYFDPETGDFQV
jgi:hypothetical protein